MTDKKNASKDTTLYYFYSVGCGWCKKAEPIVDEINGEGKFEILKLDLADSTNKQIGEELKKKYDIKCGTPWFVDAETGNGFCGYRDKETVLKWANGEEIPKPVKPTGPPPKPPLMGASKEEENKWIKEYDDWYKKNEKLPNIKTSKEILEMPRPKTDPPKPPKPNDDDKALEEWAKAYDKWKDENNHLPNLVPSEQIMTRFKQQRDARKNPQPGQPPMGANPGDIGNLAAKITSLEYKLDRLLQHLGVKLSSTPPPSLNKQNNINAKLNNSKNVKTKPNKK